MEAFDFHDSASTSVRKLLPWSETMHISILSASTLEREALAPLRIEAAFPLKGWAIALDE